MEDKAVVGIVEVLDDDQRTALEAMGTLVQFPPEQTIFWEDQPSRSVLIIQRGNVKVTKRATDGTEVILAVRGVPEIMGDEGVLMGEPRSATVTTITEVAGLDIKAEDLLEFVEKRGLWPVMYRAAVYRRRQSDERVLLARLDVKSRLARWLLELATEVGEQTAEGWVIAAALSQHDIATRIGASREAVAIELGKLRGLGIIATGRRRITLRNVAALRKISAG